MTACVCSCLLEVL